MKYKLNDADIDEFAIEYLTYIIGYHPGYTLKDFESSAIVLFKKLETYEECCFFNFIFVSPKQLGEIKKIAFQVIAEIIAEHGGEPTLSNVFSIKNAGPFRDEVCDHVREKYSERAK